MSEVSGKRPAKEPAALAAQLLQELERVRLDQVDQDEPLLYEVYSRRIMAETWRRVAAGDLSAPRVFLSELEGAQGFVNACHAPAVDPRARAAQIVHQLLIDLANAVRSVGPTQVEARLSDRQRSVVERGVLGALLQARGQYLRRGEVLQLVREAGVRCGAVRVGQILASLHAEGLLLRVEGTARGNPSASFYALNERGAELSARLKVNESPTDSSWAAREAVTAEPEITATQVAIPAGGIDRRDTRIVTFYSYRGGVGRTLAVTHTGLLLGKSHPSERILLCDLDLEAPGLNEYLEIPSAVKGIEGLLEQYLARSPDERDAWLAAAVSDPGYVHRIPEQRNVWILPSANSVSSHDALVSVERLRSELLAMAPSDAQVVGASSFLRALSTALRGQYTRVLIDAAAGVSPLSYTAAALLPDELVLCVRPSAEAPAGLRRIVHDFLAEGGSQSHRVVTFVFSPFPLAAGPPPGSNTRELDPVSWIGTRLARGGGPGNVYRIVRLHHSEELARGARLLVDARGVWLGSGTRKAHLLRLGYENLASLIRAPHADSELPTTIEALMRERAAAAVESPTPPGPGREQQGEPGALWPTSRGGDGSEGIARLPIRGTKRSRQWHLH